MPEECLILYWRNSSAAYFQNKNDYIEEVTIDKTNVCSYNYLIATLGVLNSLQRYGVWQTISLGRTYIAGGTFNMTYETGTEVFFIESNRIIRKATVVRRSGDFYILRFDEGGGIQLREGRIFPTKEQAEATLPGEKVQKKANSPYDYWH